MYFRSAVLILPALLFAGVSVGGIGVKGNDRSVVGIVFKQGANRDDTFVVGTVFEDLNKDGLYEEGREPGIPGVMVSNGRDVVLTNVRGQYKLLNIYDHGKNPTEPGAMTVFITKPAGYDVPVDADNVPQFFYYYIPDGSPPNVRGSHFASAVCRPAGHCPGA
jgi:N terminal of Calcineurin-like phosphoesterase